jgi:serine/threonine protein kinase|eukprot:scaffold1512_cov192-Alexandrium_tamarense.AAC.26
MAPELLRGSYGRSCDVWSVGVISYVLLSGLPPFNAPNDSSIMNLIRRGEYSMSGRVWEGISDNGKDFVKRLMQVDPNKRLNASEALHHPWLRDVAMWSHNHDSKVTRS